MFPPSRISTTANSRHPGGVNVGLADGSVRFVKSTINIQAWRALGTRNGGEVISSDSLLSGEATDRRPHRSEDLRMIGIVRTAGTLWIAVVAADRRPAAGPAAAR